MDQQRWQQVRAVFAEALDRQPEEWPAYLAAACQGDAELGREVGSLLAAHAQESGLFASAAPADDGGVAADPVLAAGRIGPYRIFHLLGRGGMGAVYLAARADGEYQKRVALKLLRPGLDAPDLVRRFRRERQILASLDHPFIARLLDGGTTAQGRPYLVLEYVEGRPLDLHCRAERPSLAVRLELFASICAAVHYAHQNLVVHRDLKPGNILVTAQGTPKLLDFGISKLVNPELADDTLMPTALGAEPMTPDYASPEQLRGTAVTTASDVYALGVLLYELLTGQHPFRRPGQSRAQLLHRITEEEPTRPSEALLHQADGIAEPVALALARRLGGDLDAIVLKALRKEPQLRYASVDQLAEDLRRYRQGLPVLARKGTRRYLFGKWVGRHRLAVTAVAACLAAALGFAALMGLQAQQLARERDRSDLERRRAEEVKKLLVDLFKVADPARATGETITAREVLDRGVDKLTGQLEDQPEIKADLLRTVGTIYRQLGLLKRAEPVLEQSLALRQAGGAARAESLQALAQLREEQGRLAEAKVLFEQALALRRQHAGEESPPVAETLDALGNLARKMDRPQEAEPLLERALALRRRFYPPESLEVAGTLNNLAILLATLGRYEEALPLFEELLELRRRRFGDRRLEVVDATENLGLLTLAMADLPRAEELCRRALALRRELLPDHPSIAGSLANLGAVLNQRGRSTEAAVLYGEAVERWSRAYGPRHPRVADALEGQGMAEVGLGHPDTALGLYRRALELRLAIQKEGSVAVAGSLNRIADALTRQGRYAEAGPLSDRALAARRAQLGDEHLLTLECLLVAARIQNGLGRTQEGEKLARQALGALERAHPRSWLERAEAGSVLGESLLLQGRPAEAEPWLAGSVRALGALQSPDAPVLRDARARLDRLHAAAAGRKRTA